MEPFELKLHQVTFGESDDNSGQDIGQAQKQLDSFSELVHYDADFKKKTGAEGLEQATSNFHELAYSRSGKSQQSPGPSLSTATITTAGPSSFQTRTSPSSNSPSRPSSSTSTGGAQQSRFPWEIDYQGDIGGQENFLVNADDYFLPRSQLPPVSPESAAASLRTLSHVTFNTAAVARQLRKVQQGKGKRRVAKTTLTSTALTTPLTMPSEKSNSQSTTSPAPVTSPGDPPHEAETGDGGDSSFETVAEALRLQWSVIGNANVTPASPEEVARIVAEAEKRLRGDQSSDSASLPPGEKADHPDSHSLGSVSSLSSLSSLATTDNGSGGGDNAASAHKVGTPSDNVHVSSESAASAELVRIPAQSITREVERTSWFQSKDKSVPSAQNVKKSQEKEVKVDRSGNAEFHQKVPPSVVGHVPHSDLESSTQGARPDSARGHGSGVVEPLQGISNEGKGNVAVSVPFGTGITSPTELSFQSPVASTPYSSPFPESSPTPEVFRDPHQGTASQQGSSVPPRQPSLPVPQQQSASQSQAPGHPVESIASFPPASLPVFDPRLFPTPHIGPLFPKKGDSFLPARPPVKGMAGSGDAPTEQVGGAEKFHALLKEKLKLEGQLEVLQEEAQTTLQERAELQAQLASLQLKLKTGQQKMNDAEKAGLKAELERLRATRLDHEREALEVQQMLEEKLEDLKVVTEDLCQSQDTVNKLQVRMKELRDDLQAREATVQALKSKIAELYVEVQTTLQSKMEADGEARTARNDLVSLVKAKEWYQEQLSTAHEVRAKLQRQLTQLQAQTVSQGSIVERLKLESGRLRQQLRESQERALRDKEQLARHLETIQQDMMEREAAFQEIQRERLMIEDTFNTQVTTVEEEKSRISNLLQLISELESQLEQAHRNSKKKQEHVFTLENEHMDLMKKVTLTQEVLVEKEQLLEETNQKLIEVESQLDVFMKTVAAKDAELLKLREDKASTEIALKAALQEKESVDKALETLKGDMGKVEKSFKQMRQELGSRSAELETVQSQQKTTRDELDRVAHELDIKNRSVETLTVNHQEQTTVIQKLQAEKSALEQQVTVWRGQLEQTQLERNADNSAEQQKLWTELHEARARLAEMEGRLETTTAQLQQSAAAMSATATAPTQDTTTDKDFQALTEERDSLLQEVDNLREDKQRLEADQEMQAVKLTAEVDSLRGQLSERTAQFEQRVQGCVDEVRQVAEEKQRLETELEMVRRRFELGSLQQQEHITAELQNLMKELEAAHSQKQSLESNLQVLQTQKEAEISALRQQLVEMQRLLEEAAEDRVQQNNADSINQQLALELEKERGRIAGLQQSNSTLKDHMKQLEEALAGRESSLLELNSLLERSGQDREKDHHEFLRRIQGLEVSLKKEKDGGRDLRKQIGTKITENKRLTKQQEAHKKEQADLQEQLEHQQKTAATFQSDLDLARQNVRELQEEIHTLRNEKHQLEGELERARRELVDSADRNPVLVEQIQNLEWQMCQKAQEVEASKEQLVLAEQRQASEMDNLRRTLQDKQEEVDSLQAELASARQEKADQKSRVSELRSVLKASVQHHKITKKLNSKKKEKTAGGGDSEEKATQADLDNGIIIPPLPFKIEDVEQLLMDTAVRPLDSKPLDNLSTCLSSLRAEISGLQKQMEVHTTTIHTSTQSWRSVESEVKGLQEVVRSIANTIMDASHTNTNTTTTTAGEAEIVDDTGVIHL